MSQRLLVGTLVLLVALLAWTRAARAQAERLDLIELESGKRLSGKVLEESWKSVKLDTDMDGKADETCRTEEVKDVTYGKRPSYMIDALLLRSKPETQQQYLDTLMQAYADKTTSKWVLQHAYYDIVKQYQELSLADEQYVGKTVEAARKLVEDIPDSRYVPELRINLGDMFLIRGNLEQARMNYQGAVGQGYSQTIESRARLRQARASLLENNPDQAEAVLNQVNVTGLGTLAEAQLTVMRAGVLAAHKDHDKAYDVIRTVLAGRRQPAIEPEAYLVLGDVFRMRDRNEEALLSYLRVHLMYEDVDPITRARALAGAIKVCRRMDRREQAGELQTELLKRFPGPFWEERVKQ